jgi:hypothetical protein
LEYLIHISGILALIGCVLGFQVKNPRYVLYILSAPCLLWALHFALLAQWAGVAISLIAFVRNLSAAKIDDELVMQKITTLCLVMSMLVTCYIFEGYKDLLPLMATVSNACAAYLRNKPLFFRSVCLSVEFSWLAYGLLIGSVFCSLTSAILIISILVSIYRYDYKKQHLEFTPLNQTAA